MRDIRVASVQFEHKAGDKKANLIKIRDFVEEAKKEQVELIVFPECCVTGYWYLRNLSRDELSELVEEGWVLPLFAAQLRDEAEAFTGFE